LVKILAGVVKPDSGSIFLGGVRVEGTPRRRQRMGIEVVHQDRNICPDLSIAENFALSGDLPHVTVHIPRSRRRAEERMRESLRAACVEVDIHAKASELSISQQQAVEVARAIHRGARVIILDEPTSALQRYEIELLHSRLRRMVAESGISVIYISHHLRDVVEICDEICVLRDGEIVTRLTAAEAEERSLPHLMFGGMESTSSTSAIDRPEIEASLVYARGADRTEDPVLVIEDVTYRSVLRGVTLSICPGEIVALRGDRGDGAEELGRIAAGELRPDSGRCVVRDHTGRSRTVSGRRQAASCGIAFIPGDRLREAVVKDLSVRENLMMARLSSRRHGPLVTRGDRSAAQDAYRMTSVRGPGLAASIEALSGGNQQKVVLARWLMTHPRVAVLENPTAGVDVRSRFEIYGHIRRLASATGSAVVLIPTDESEAEELATRSVWLRNGKLDPNGMGSA
jgi:ABC-type sugar transport system ATPase subunit